MKNKYILFLLSFLLMGVLSVSAQQRSSKKHFDVDKFKREKADYIISEVGLTDEEAKAFVPLMNELMDKKIGLNRSARSEAKRLRNKKDKTDADYKRLTEVNLEIHTKELELDKQYYQKFQKILSSEKIYKYQKAEAKFIKRTVGRR